MTTMNGISLTSIFAGGAITLSAGIAIGVNVSVIFAYLGPTSIIQADYLPLVWKKALSCLMIGVWYGDLFMQIVMAVNRVSSVVYFKYNFFTRSSCWITSIGIYVFSIFVSFAMDYIVPCCTIYIHYAAYSYAYIEHEATINTYIDLLIDIGGSTTCFILYGFLFFNVHKASAAVKEGMTTVQVGARRNKEIRYAAQFGFGTVLACLAWVTFRIFPLVVSKDAAVWGCMTAIMMIGHCMATSLVFLLFNHEFQTKFFHPKSPSVGVMSTNGQASRQNVVVPSCVISSGIATTKTKQPPRV